MINLSPPPENMNSIPEACGIVGGRASPHLLEITKLLADTVCLTLHDFQTSETK